MGLFAGPAPKMLDRLGTTDVQPSTLSTVALVYHVVDGDNGERHLYPPEAWRIYQTERGICWLCGDTLPMGARFCIACRAEMPPVTGETGRLYVPPALGKTERL